MVKTDISSVEEVKELVESFKSMDLEHPGDFNESEYELQMRVDNWDEIARRNGREASVVQPINANMLNAILKSDEVVLM